MARFRQGIARLKLAAQAGSSADEPPSSRRAGDTAPAPGVRAGGADGEEELIARARQHDATAFELLLRRHNQRVFRVVRSLLRDPAEIEEVMQQAHVQAFLHLDQFAGSARWSTWVCRIAVNEALARLRQRGRFVSFDAMSDSFDDLSEQQMTPRAKAPGADPERDAAQHEFRGMLEQAIDALPEMYRAVLVLREIEGMNTAEVADVLAAPPDVIKTRLHRARKALRGALEKRVGEEMKNAYAFGDERCDRVVSAVLARLARRD